MAIKNNVSPLISGASIQSSNGKSTPAFFKVSIVTPILMDFYMILSLVFGGCCSNVWTYEHLLRVNANIGSALTFSQMLFITLQLLPSFLTFTPSSFIPSLRPRQVPLSYWALQVVLLTTSLLLNNWAYAYDVPLSILIVFRSASLAVSMLLGIVILKRRYTIAQMFAVLSVSAGVVLVTLSKPTSTTKSFDNQDLSRYTTGISMLVFSLFLTGLLGIVQERTYKAYGPCWKEGIFYTHFLSLPIFIFFASDIKQGLVSLSSASSGSNLAYVILVANLLTQLVCVSGVNRLTSKVSSVSTNLALTVRKALSLCLSVWWFGNGWNTQLGLGASMVFLGSLLFTLISRETKDKKE